MKSQKPVLIHAFLLCVDSIVLSNRRQRTFSMLSCGISQTMSATSTALINKGIVQCNDSRQPRHSTRHSCWLDIHCVTLPDMLADNNRARAHSSPLLSWMVASFWKCLENVSWRLINCVSRFKSVQHLCHWQDFKFRQLTWNNA